MDRILSLLFEGFCERLCWNPCRAVFLKAFPYVVWLPKGTHPLISPEGKVARSAG
jgi:hypothetical protein